MPWWVYLLGRLWSAQRPRSCPVWVDYFCLRQCQSDFDKKKIKELVAKIRYTVMLLACGNEGKPVVFTRIFCIFEVHCSVEGGAKLCGVLNSGQAFVGSMAQWWNQDDIVRAATGTNKEHEKAIRDSIANTCGIEDLNQRVGNVMRRFAASTFEQYVGWAIVLSVLFMEGFAAWRGLRNISGSGEGIGAAMSGIAACVGALVSVPIFQRLVRRSDGTAGAGPMVGHACTEICCWHGSVTCVRFVMYFMFWRVEDLLDAFSDAAVLAMLVVIVILSNYGWFNGNSGDLITTMSFVTGIVALCGALLDYICYLIMPDGSLSGEHNWWMAILFGCFAAVQLTIGSVCKLLQFLHRHRQDAVEGSSFLMQSEPTSSGSELSAGH